MPSSTMVKLNNFDVIYEAIFFEKYFLNIFI